MKRGEFYLVRKPGSQDPRKQRVFVVSRQVLVDSRFSTLICAPVYSRHDGLSTQVRVGTAEGLKKESSMGKWNFSLIHAQAIHKLGVGQTGRRIWMDVGWREGRPSQLQAPGEPVYSHHRASSKRGPVGRAVDTVKKIRLELK